MEKKVYYKKEEDLMACRGVYLLLIMNRSTH